MSIPENKKPPIPISYSESTYTECMSCETKHIKHICTPWIVLRFRGGDNFVRRLICTECYHWHEEYMTAAILRSNAPVKNKYDKIYSKINLKDIVDQFEKVEEWRRKKSYR